MKIRGALYSIHINYTSCDAAKAHSVESYLSSIRDFETYDVMIKMKNVSSS